MRRKLQLPFKPTESAIESPDVSDQTMSCKQPKKRRTKKVRADTACCDGEPSLRLENNTRHTTGPEKEKCAGGQQNTTEHPDVADHNTRKTRKRKCSRKMSNVSVTKRSFDSSDDEDNPTAAAVPSQSDTKLQGKPHCAKPRNSSKVEQTEKSTALTKQCFKSEVVHSPRTGMPQNHNDNTHGHSGVHDGSMEDIHKVLEKRKKTGVFSPQCKTATSTAKSQNPSLQTLDNFLVDTSQNLKPSSPPDNEVPKLDIPAPKRSRLSLKGMKCKPTPDKPTENNTHSLPSNASSRMTNGSSHMSNDSSHMTGPAAVQCSQKRNASKRPSSRKTESSSVPCVTAFHNLGNTCYLNSVLQVLRYTPGFVQQVQSLAHELKLSQKQAEEADSSEEEEEGDDAETHLLWKLVHDLDKMFKKMSSTERKFQSGDTDYIALRPYEILDVLEKLNPMFEGNDQHDCHELLRCLLSYVEEAAKQLNKLRQGNRVKYAPLLSALLALKPVTYKGDDVDSERDSKGDRSRGCLSNGCPAVSDDEEDGPMSLDKTPAPASTTALKDAGINSEQSKTDPPVKKRKRSSEEPTVKKLCLLSKDLSESECKPNKENCTLKEDGDSIGCPTTKLKNRVIGSPIQQNSIVGYMVAADTGAQTNRESRMSRQKKRYGATRTIRHSHLESDDEEKAVSIPAVTVTVHHQGADSERNLKPLSRQTARKSVPHHKNISQMTMTTLEQKAKAGGAAAAVVIKSLGKCPKSVNVTSIGRSVQPVPNLVKDTFEGVMALRTKCLVCEGYTERREEYQDVSLPAKQLPRNDSDSEDGESEESLDPGIGWMLDAVREREMLIGNNKYRCECCNSLVEAERSQHYPTIPPVLTIQLKRFAAFSRSSQEFTKINDHVPTARVLPCIKADCQSECVQNNHRYELYAAITHTGISLSSGHYVAYVKTPPLNNKHFRHQTPAPHQLLTNQTPASQSCDAKSANESQVPDANNNGQSLTKEKKSIMAKKQRQSGKDKVAWYECDDELIMPLSEKDFNKMLDPSGTATPYLLFYRTLTK